ncbi:hypothetical protein SERLA73DRAFT_75901 [Serpula lacrymans var. lacrymans S7.3]|uniref:C2H2-type domain-containing protein n=2 Tax=Serpula lacrymans var. lacrymans TaxID=341189 RepID=F8Q4J8_SERL3|nr:uncharacterized protein SERLADRAFT_440669 [Serpula lacrymans var. lacrymans S7.9]EGN97053.1 hypothetical protein SERLA73DRAFT_75901 [Serpula lacrymans var. lacrymans S7.3]EGO22649.1 hypothetical protein SERLADRAFT_440669 [Serpula lacrymans var. lacrymans S7.9]
MPSSSPICRTRPCQAHNAKLISCGISGCQQWFYNQSGLTKHTRTHHLSFLNALPPQNQDLYKDNNGQDGLDSNVDVQEENVIQDIDDEWMHNVESDVDVEPNMDEEPVQDDNKDPLHEYNNMPGVEEFKHHPLINGLLCDECSIYLYAEEPPNPPPSPSKSDWTLYHDHIEFETAQLLYQKTQASAGNIDILMNFCAQDLYGTINPTLLGDVAWQSFSLAYNGKL